MGDVTRLSDKKGQPTKMPSKDDLFKHKKRFEAIKSEMDELRGDMGSLVKNADNDSNIHKKAFKLVMQALRMSDDKRSAFLAHFDKYREDFELDSQMDLPLGDVAAANT